LTPQNALTSLPPPPAPPHQKTTRKKKNPPPPPLTHLCPPCATPFSKFSLDCRRNDARIVENGFATTSGVSKSAKVVLGRVLIKSRLVTETRSMSALAHFAYSSRTCTLRSGELLAATKEAFRVPQNLRANDRIGTCCHHNGPRLPTWGPPDNIGFRRIARHDCYARRRVRVSLPDIGALPVRFPSIDK